MSSNGTLRLIGISESAGAIGLIVPAATRILPVLTPLAAIALGVMMVLAMGLHARREEPEAIAFNVVLLAAAAFVAWGRLGPYAL